MGNNVEIPPPDPRLIPTRERTLNVGDGNDALILRSATVNAMKGTKVWVDTCDGLKVMDQIIISGNGTITIKLKDPK